MAQGVVIKDAQGNIKQVPFDQLQQTDPFLYSQYVKNVAQPNASLQQTQTSTGAEAVRIPGAIAESQVQQNDANKVSAINLIQKLFDANKGSDNKVSPQTYNAAKSSAASLGIDSGAFDSKFKDSYTNPNNHYYDTPEDKNIQQSYDQTKRQIQATIDAYNSIPDDQKGLISKSALSGDSGFGELLGKVIAPQATEYQKQVAGLSAQLKDILGGGTGSGLKISQTELNNWTNLLPSPKKTEEQNNYDLTQLDKQLKAAFNLGTGLDEHYLPSKGRAPLSSFNK